MKSSDLVLLHYHIIQDIKNTQFENLKFLKPYRCLTVFISNLPAKPTIKRFGFHVETFCGKIPQNNKWTDDWIV